jgi:hypothetical protein
MRTPPHKEIDPDYPRSGEHFIVKAQISIFTSESGPLMLIYDQRREFELQFPVTPPWATAMGRDLKRFFAAQLEPDRLAGKHKYKMAIRARVVDRNW